MAHGFNRRFLRAGRRRLSLVHLIFIAIILYLLLRLILLPLLWTLFLIVVLIILLKVVLENISEWLALASQMVEPKKGRELE